MHDEDERLWRCGRGGDTDVAVVGIATCRNIASSVSLTTNQMEPENLLGMYTSHAPLGDSPDCPVRLPKAQNSNGAEDDVDCPVVLALCFDLSWLASNPKNHIFVLCCPSPCLCSKSAPTGDFRDRKQPNYR